MDASLTPITRSGSQSLYHKTGPIYDVAIDFPQLDTSRMLWLLKEALTSEFHHAVKRRRISTLLLGDGQIS